MKRERTGSLVCLLVISTTSIACGDDTGAGGASTATGTTSTVATNNATATGTSGTTKATAATTASASNGGSTSSGAMAAYCQGGAKIYEGSYQSGAIPDDFYQQEVADDGLEAVGAPWDPNRFAMRALIREGESWNGNGYPRSEVVAVKDGDAVLLEWGKKYCLTSGFWFDATATFPQGDIIAGFQLHGDDGVTSPPLGFYVNEGELVIDVGSNNNETHVRHPVGPVPLGEYVPFEIYLEPSPDADGRIRVTLGDEIVLEDSGPNNYSDNPTAGYLKQGLYDWGNRVDDSLAVYLDDLVVYEMP